MVPPNVPLASNGPQVPIVNAPSLYVNGLLMCEGYGQQILYLGAGAARDSTNVNDIILPALDPQPDGVPDSFTIDVGAVVLGNSVGANGVDVALVVANSIYAVYVIGDSTDHKPAAGLLSLNYPNSPVSLVSGVEIPYLPEGYDMFRRVGWVATDGSANFLVWKQYGLDDNSRKYYYDSPIVILAVTASTPDTYTGIPLYAVTTTNLAMPPIATDIHLLVQFTGISSNPILSLAPFLTAGTAAYVWLSAPEGGTLRDTEVVPCAITTEGVSEIQYKTLNAGETLTLYLNGFVDLL